MRAGTEDEMEVTVKDVPQTQDEWQNLLKNLSAIQLEVLGTLATNEFCYRIAPASKARRGRPLDVTFFTMLELAGETSARDGEPTKADCKMADEWLATWKKEADSAVPLDKDATAADKREVGQLREQWLDGHIRIKIADSCSKLNYTFTVEDDDAVTNSEFLSKWFRARRLRQEAIARAAAKNAGDL